VDFTFDPAKNARNIDVHGISFYRVIDFDWSLAIHLEDARRDYGERRFGAFGPIDGRLHVLVYTPRGASLHVISLRKANKREVRRYARQIQTEEDLSGSRQP
jgi:uncharacterized DUF497 family protein